MKLLRIIYTFLLFLASQQLILAQPGADPFPAGVPIDGGVIALAVAGGAYGVRKLMQQRKDEE